jgi:hypothetical protein
MDCEAEGEGDLMNNRIGFNVSLAAVVGIIVVIAAVLLSLPHSAVPAERAEPSFGADTDAAYYYPVGTVLAWSGWVVGMGGNQYGHWFDLADAVTQGSPNGKSIRCYTPANLAKYGKNSCVHVVGKIAAKGQIQVLRVTVDYQNQYPILPKFRVADRSQAKEPAQE